MNLHGDKGAAAGLIAMAGALALLAIVVIVAKVLG